MKKKEFTKEEKKKLKIFGVVMFVLLVLMVIGSLMPEPGEKQKAEAAPPAPLSQTNPVYVFKGAIKMLEKQKKLPFSFAGAKLQGDTLVVSLYDDFNELAPDQQKVYKRILIRSWRYIAKDEKTKIRFEIM